MARMEDEGEIARIEAAILPVVRAHGLELVDVEWRPLKPRGSLRVFVDKPGGVGIDDCERLSHEVGDVLDAADLFAGPWDLEVSSPGLERVLRKERELRWAVGKPVRCWLAGGREVRGRLAAVEPDRLILERNGERQELLRAEVTKTRLEADVPWARRG